MTQERRRYGFVLERQCSLAKHYLSYHSQGVTVYQQNIDEWSEVAKTREFLPEAVESMFTNRMRVSAFHCSKDNSYTYLFNCTPYRLQLKAYHI